MKTRAGLLLFCSGALLLTGCSNQDTPGPAPVTGSASMTATTPATQGDEDDNDLQTVGPLGEVTQRDQVMAHDSAIAFLRAFTDTGQDASTWWAALAPLLAPAAVEDYSYIDPAQVPAMKVTAGPVEDLPGGSASLWQAQVPTTLGPCTVTLTRDAAAAPWLVARADLPAPAQ